MSRFKWCAEYFSTLAARQCVRREIIEADNAYMAQKMAKARLGTCKRVGVRRVATAAPVRIVYADTQRSAKAPMATIIAALTRAVGAPRRTLA